MKLIFCRICSILFLAILSAQAQFTLGFAPVSPGTGALHFTLESGFYYCLESSGDLVGGFAPVSGWMLGDGSPVTWPVHYPTSPVVGGETTVPAGDAFTLFPFTNGKTLVTWTGFAEARYSVLVAQDYSALPPIVVVPESAPLPSVMLLAGRIAWDPAYESLTAALLPPAQQAYLTHFPTPAAAIQAATAGGASGTGVAIDAEKHFFRLRRMEADADGDGLDWAQETFLFHTDPNDADSDHDGISDGDEIALGLKPGSDDSDGDGVKDGSDAYPDDPRRSEDIPVKFYGVIDLSQYQYQGQPVQADNVTAIAIDDGNNVSWINAGPTSHTQTPPNPGDHDDYIVHHTSTVTVTTWKDGQVTGVMPSVSEFWAGVDWSETAGNWTKVNHEIGADIAFASVNGSGLAVGSTSASDKTMTTPRPRPPANDPFDIDRITHTVPDNLAVPSNYLETEDWYHTDNNAINYDTTLFIGMSYSHVSNGGGAPGLPLPISKAGTMSYVYRDGETNRLQGFKVFRGAGSSPEFFPDNGVEPGPISDTGLIVNSLPSTVPPKNVLWKADGSTVQFNPAGVGVESKAINNSNQIVGDLHTEEPQDDQHPHARGWLGFLWVPDDEGTPTSAPSTGHLQTFHDLLPEKFRKQLRNAVPFLITNEDPETHKTKITFSTESWEGPAESGQWKPRTGSMELIPADGGQPAQVFVQLMDIVRPRNEDGSAGDPPAISPAGRNIKDVMVQGTPMTTPEGEIKIPLLAEVEVQVRKNRNLEGSDNFGEWTAYQKTDFQGLRIATLSHALYADPPSVKGPDWIFHDPDHFRIKATLPEKKGEGTVSAWISTKNPPNPLGADWNDDESEIELIEQPAGSGVFYSARQILVADDVDDQQAVQAKWEGGPTVNIAQDADNIKNDPTHKIALGGWVYLKLPGRSTAGAIAPVPVEKVVSVEPVILSTSTDPIPTWATTPALVRDNDLKKACERMATAGIKLEFPTKLDGSVKIPTPVGNPAGVSENGIIDGLDSSGALAQEAKDLFKGSPPKGANTVRVYFAAQVRHSNGTGGYARIAAFSTPPSVIPAPNSNRILIGIDKKSDWTCGHELMHLLLNCAHDTNGSPNYGWPGEGTLQSPAPVTIWLWSVTQNNEYFTSTKRIRHEVGDDLNQRKALKIKTPLARPPSQ